MSATLPAAENGTDAAKPPQLKRTMGPKVDAACRLPTAADWRSSQRSRTRAKRKTTTIRTLLDLLHPTSGGARLFGLDSRRDSGAVHARLGNLPGDFSYDKRLTGRELLEFFAELRGISAHSSSRSGRRFKTRAETQ